MEAFYVTILLSVISTVSGKSQGCQNCGCTYGQCSPWEVTRDDHFILDFNRGQVSVSSSAAASVKYPPPGQGPPHAYISSLSSAKADPKIPVSIIGNANGTGQIVQPEQPSTSPTTPPPPQWGYKPGEGVIGPENWKTIAPKCGGQHQSPIEISIEVTVDKPLDSPLVMAMPGADPTVANKLIVQGKLINNGKAIGYNIDTAATAVKLSGGILGADTFTLRQFHFHFGCEGEMGSEHTLEGERFAGEIHLVFTNDKYPDAKTAMQQPDGLAILAFFMKVNPEKEGANKALERITGHIDAVKAPKQQTVFPDGISLTNMIPLLAAGVGNLRRFAYKGSLPTPPCFETVTWIVFRKAIEIGPTRLQKWRELQGDFGKKLCGNFRPVQPLNERNVFFFHPDVAPATTPGPTGARPTTAAPTGTTPAVVQPTAVTPSVPATTAATMLAFMGRPGSRRPMGNRVGRLKGLGQLHGLYGSRDEVKTDNKNTAVNGELSQDKISEAQLNFMKNARAQGQKGTDVGSAKNLKDVPLVNQNIVGPVVSEKANESKKLAAPTVAPGMKRGG